MKAGLIIGIGILAYVIYGKAKIAFDISDNIKFTGLKFGGDIQTPIIHASFDINNTSDIAVNLDEISGNLLAANKAFATVNLEQKIRLVPGVNKVWVTATSNIVHLGFSVINLIRKKDYKNFMFDGTITADAVDINVQTNLIA